MSSTPSIGAVCTLVFRAARPCRARGANIGVRRVALQRQYADKATNDASKLPTAAGDVGPNMQQAEHVSEEAAKYAKMMGQQGPDIEGQGTPVQEILKKEPDVKESAPKVMKQEAGKRSFSTYARRMQPEITGEQMPDGELDSAMIPTQSQRSLEVSASSTPRPPTKQDGHKFGLPTLPIPPRAGARYRDEPIVTQLTKLMMEHGKLARAQNWMAHILSVLRTSSPPVYPSNRPLLPGAPLASQLPLNPVAYLTLAIDSVAPLMRLRSQKGAAGGGVALQIPVPLGLRQRRRTAFQWVLDAASKKKSRGSGNMMFPQKVAEELISLVEGKSAIWLKRDQVHRAGTVARVNLKVSARRR